MMQKSMKRTELNSNFLPKWDTLILRDFWNSGNRFHGLHSIANSVVDFITYTAA